MATRRPLLPGEARETSSCYWVKLWFHSSSSGGVLAGAQNIVHQTVHSDRVTEIQTALDHISIIALPEKITRVAAGSQAMQIEWHGNDVFIKPLQSGQATDLMVWTEHQFSTYELEAPGDVKQMTFVLDETTSPVPHASGTAAAADSTAKKIGQITESAIGSALLHVTPIVPRGVRPQKDHVNVCIKDVVRDGDGLLRSLRSDEQQRAAVSRPFAQRLRNRAAAKRGSVCPR